MLHLQKLSVPVEYPVCFTRDVFAASNSAFTSAVSRKEPARRHRVLVVLDAGVAGCWPELTKDIQRYVEAHDDRLELVGDPLIVQGGEAVKNCSLALTFLQGSLNAYGMDRQSCLVVVGGGAVLDMAGYAAATVHRGIRIVRVPTTVLSQADSGLGVKNGINAFGKKNFLGTFAPPFAVLNDCRFLDTLNRGDVIAGMAEAVKVALIKDKHFFEWLLRHSASLAVCEPETVAPLIRRSAQLHLDHMAHSGDPFEQGSTRPLDFGHWAAHKLESLTDYRLRHGEAVAIGIAIDTIYSSITGLMAAEARDRVLGLLERLGFCLWDESLDLQNGARPAVLGGLAEFREHLGGELTITLLADIGRGFEAHHIDPEVMCAALDDLHAFSRHSRWRAGPRSIRAGSET